MSVDSNNKVLVRKYQVKDEGALFTLLKHEGKEWRDYWHARGHVNYLKVLSSSTVYVLCTNGSLCGYIRCKDDGGFGLYVYDLLIDKDYRNKGYGRLLLEHAHAQYSGNNVYILSDADLYYEKLGYEKVGSVFSINKRKLLPK